MNTQTLSLAEITDRSANDLLQEVTANHQILRILMPDGDEVMIRPKSALQPLPELPGFVPSGWKDEIYAKS